jgi:prevent-host-death family protein
VEAIGMTTFSAREFNRDVSGAKRAADEGPVVITDRGEPAYVLLSFADYNEIRDRRSLVDVLQMHEDVDFEPVVSRAHPQAAEL